MEIIYNSHDSLQKAPTKCQLSISLQATSHVAYL